MKGDRYGGKRTNWLHDQTSRRERDDRAEAKRALRRHFGRLRPHDGADCRGQRARAQAVHARGEGSREGQCRVAFESLRRVRPPWFQSMQLQSRLTLPGVPRQRGARLRRNVAQRCPRSCRRSLRNSWTARPKGDGWGHEIKIDGYRIAAAGLRRRGFSLHAQGTRLDGEVRRHRGKRRDSS